MKDLGLLPPLERLFALGFLGENAGVAYTVSGAFVGWVHDRFGAAAVRAWYGGRALPEVTGAPWAELEQRWHEDLDRVALPEAAQRRGQGALRPARPSSGGAARTWSTAAGRTPSGSARAGDYDGAIAAFEEVLALDPHDDGARVAIALDPRPRGRRRRGRARARRGSRRVRTCPATSATARWRSSRDLALVTGEGEEAPCGATAS